MLESQSSRTPLEASRQLPLWIVHAPIILATLAVIGFSVASMFVRLTMSHPQTPWESAILCDAWRASHGQPVYESRSQAGHATHLYGALASQTIGLFFRILPPNIYIGRLLTLAASIAACSMLLFAFVDRKRLFDVFVGAGLLIGLHYRCRAYFVETRPDMIGLLLATVSMFCLFAASRSDRPGRFAKFLSLGILFIVLAFFYKQTYAAFAAVPIVAMSIISVTVGRPKSLSRTIAIAIVPLIAMGIVVVTLRLFAPNVYFYMIAEAAMYKIPRERIVTATLAVVTMSPLFFVVLSSIAIQPTLFDSNAANSHRFRDQLIWLLSACLIGAGAGVLAFAKRGGSYNSLLLAWTPTTIFVVATIGPMIRRMIAAFSSRFSIVPLAATCIIAGLIIITTFSVPSSDKWNWNYSAGGDAYTAVEGEVEYLNGRVICPDDPMLPLIAKRQLGRSLEAELDANGRVGFSPGLINEIDQADWMILVVKQPATPQFAAFDDGRFSSTVMQNFGYVQIKKPPFDKTYTLWKRDPSKLPRASTQSSSTTTKVVVQKKYRAAPERP